MSRELSWGRVAFAYLVAVLIAVAATLSAVLIPTVEASVRTWGSYIRNAGDLYRFGVMVTCPTALPGFLLTLFVARRASWVGWLPYACAGTLNAYLALEILGIFLQSYVLGMPLDKLLPCLPGGFAGGFAYWAVVRRSLLSKGEIVSP